MRTYWITGASSGIGEALVMELSKKGAQLILSARNSGKLLDLKNRLANPLKVKILPFDLKNSSEAQAVTEKAWNCFGSVDVVILNAGLSQRSLVRETDMKVYRELMEVNYFGNIALTHALLPFFSKANRGQFVVVSSLVGKFGTPYRSGYAASKHALHGYYDSLRAELMRDNKNIDVTIICPGFVATNISFNALGGEGQNLGTYDEANAEGLKPAVFARRALKAIDSRKYETYIGGKETFGIVVKRLFPNIFVRILARAKVR